MEEFIAIFVRNLDTDRVEHYEVFEGTGLPAAVLATKITTRVDELHDRFGIDRHDVFWEGYNSLQALHRGHPELGSLDSLRALIRSA